MIAKGHISSSTHGLVMRVLKVSGLNTYRSRLIVRGWDARLEDMDLALNLPGIMVPYPPARTEDRATLRTQDGLAIVTEAHLIILFQRPSAGR